MMTTSGLGVLLATIVTFTLIPIEVHGNWIRQMQNASSFSRNGGLDLEALKHPSKAIVSPALIANKHESLKYLLVTDSETEEEKTTEDAEETKVKGDGRRKRSTVDDRSRLEHGVTFSENGGEHIWPDRLFHRELNEKRASSTIADRFFGMRGKKRPVPSDGFVGMRGKKERADDVFPITDGIGTWIKRPSMDAFYGMRGKKDGGEDGGVDDYDTAAFYDADYDKRSPKDGFLGMRGKKLKWKRKITDAFMGMRGKKRSSSSYDQSNGNVDGRLGEWSQQKPEEPFPNEDDDNVEVGGLRLKKSVDGGSDILQKWVNQMRQRRMTREDHRNRHVDDTFIGMRG